MTSGQLSLATRQALNLVPEAAAGQGVGKQLSALGGSERIDAATRAFARSELALRAAQALDGKDAVAARRYYLIAAPESARLSFPDGKMIHVDPFDQKYRLASAFYSLAAGRYFLLLMASGPDWTGDITETTVAGTFEVTFDNDDTPTYSTTFHSPGAIASRVCAIATRATASASRWSAAAHRGKVSRWNSIFPRVATSLPSPSI